MSIYAELAELEAKGEAGALCTVISSHGSTPRHEGSKMLVYPDGRFIGTVGGGEMEGRVIKEALAAIKDGKSRRLSYSLINPKEGDPGICGGTMEVYVEPLPEDPEVLIIGGGHVGKAVSHLAKWLGFRVIVSDDRSEFCTKEFNPDADEFYSVAMKDLCDIKKVKSSTSIILTTRGVAVDVPGLPSILKSQAGYIGVIGSRRRWLSTKKALEELGIPEDLINRVHSPIGLELNAETPEEIAVSIMAEILMLRNGGTGKQMKI